jgi:SNF2 family DNA or RNA helicase
MLRRTRAEVKRELPGLTIIPHTVDCDPAPLKDVENAAMTLARVIIEGSGKKHEQFLASGELSSLVRKATGVAKAPYVAEFVNLLLESEQKIVLFGWHHDVYSIWRERLKEHKVSMFTGEESDSQKQKSEDDFIRGDSRVLIMSVRAAAGLDGLQHICRTGVIGEPDYSPGVHEQCYTRLYRDEQKDPVTIYFPLADDGSDPVIADILQLKRTQIEGVRSPDRDVMDTLETDGTRIRKLAEFYLAKQKKLRKAIA